MGDKLSPPLLSGTIPAFYSSDEGIVITIPFSMNRVVSLNQVDAFQVKIKTVQSGTQLISMRVSKNNNQKNEIQFIVPKKASNYDTEYNAAITEYQTQLNAINENYINGNYETIEDYNNALDTAKKEHQERLATLPESGKNYEKFKIGQYYKIQIAYINDDMVGYYSSVAVAKYTTKPEVSINHLTEGLNPHLYSYTGIYSQSGLDADKTERVYSYRFDLYDATYQLVDTSGDLLHNSENDELASSQDTYKFNQDLPLNQTYTVKYTVITNNGLEVSSKSYRIMQKPSIDPELNVTAYATLNYDNGYVDVGIKAINIGELASGFFIIVRSSQDSNFTEWEEVYRFHLTAQIPTKHLYRDFTVEQGKRYCYGIQQYNNNNLFSNRILSNYVDVDFEDAFLFDGVRQLKIKYNPKVSSFKKDLLEQKTDTIGGKHPFIFRNGRVYYSEFPISGLISYQMDEENLFLSEEDYGLTEKTTNLTGDNIAAERIFKMKVLEWLTDGKPKVFRSPTEGNFIVRLMNSSLTPNDTVGRMLHTFSSTAYEVADFNYETLNQMNFIIVNNDKIISLQWETVELAPRNSVNVITPLPANTELLKYNAITVRFDGMAPGETAIVTFTNGSIENIKIGATGSYYVDTGIEITSIKMQNVSSGTVTYSYYYEKEPMFNNISDVNIIEMPQHQFIGEHDILTELLCVYDSQAVNEDGTLGAWVKNPKLQLINIYNIDVEKRPLQRIDSIESTSLLADPFLMYELGTYEIKPGVSPTRPEKIFTLNKYYDGYNEVDYENYQPILQLNGNSISLNEIERTSYRKPDKPTELKSNNGVLVNLSYSMGTIVFNIENTAIQEYNNSNTSHWLYGLGSAINDYENAKKSLDDLLKEDSMDDSEEYIAQLNAARADIQTTYNAYILTLIETQQEDKRRKGEIA